MVNFDRTILVVGNIAQDQANIYRRQLKQDATVSFQILTEPYDGPILERCQAQPLDVILLDSYFPDNRGFQLLEVLQTQLADRCPPIIVIDTNDAHLAKRALRAGAADYLVREEMNADALHQAIQVMCSTVTRPGPRDRAQLLAVSSDLEVIAGQDGHFHWVSPNFEQVLGWSPTEMVAHPWMEFVHPDDIETSILEADRIFKGIETRNFEHRFRHKDGSYRWLLWRSRLDIARQILYGTAIDITARKQTEAALRASEEKYRRLFNSIDEGFCIIELIYDEPGRAVDWIYLEANEAFAQQTGWQQPVGKRVRELEPDLEESWFDTFAQLVATREPMRFTSEAAAMNRWYDVFAFPIGEAHEPRVALLFEDITERKRAEAEQTRMAQLDAFRVALSDALRPLADANEVQTVACRLLGEAINASRVYYYEYDEAAQQGVIHQDYTQGDLPSVVGVYHFEDFPAIHILLSLGQPLILADVANSEQLSVAERDRLKPLRCDALVSIPLVKNQQLTAVFSVCCAAPHDWSPLELSLIQETADRTWAAVEHARAEMRLRGSKEEFHLLVTASSDIIYKMSADWLEMHYLEGKDFLASTHQPNRTWLERYVLTEDQPQMLAAIAAAIRTGSTFELEHRVIRQDGSFGWLFSRAVPLKNEHGEIMEWMGAANDITARKQAETALQQANQALRQKTHQLEIVNAELQKTVEELQVTEEELRQQNQELDLTRHHVVAESRRYQDLFDFAPDGYVVTDANGIIQEANQAFAALVGVNREELVYIPLKIYIGNADRLSFQNLRYELYQQPPSQRLQTDELHLRTTAGHPIPVAITGTAIWDDHEQIGGFRWLIQDITDRKRAAAAIAADLEDTRLLHELSTRLITETDSQKLYEQILDTAIALSRADAGSFQCLELGTDELQLLVTRGFGPTLIERFDRIVASSATSCGRALASGQRAFVDFDTPCDQPDASLQMHLDAGFVSAQSTPLLSRSGQLIGMFSTHWCNRYRPNDRELRFLDLLARQAADLLEQHQADTKRQQLLEREQAARAEAEQANRVKDEFLAILSHELRSPLNPILGWSKLLQTHNLDEAKTQRALSTIERNAKLLTQLINDLLDVARILRGKLQIAEQPINLATVIEAATEVVNTAANAKSISIDTHLSQGVLVQGDDARLQQIVWNLLSNAVKFTPDEGSIEVRLTTVDHRAQITITDTGIGIHPDFLPRLFDAFLQEDVSITRRYGGLGLGLSIVKYLVEAHGGTITAESPGEGLGATFTVYLPLLQSQRSVPAAQTRAPQQPNLSGIKVLAVDDRADARELLQMLLAEYGAEAIVVASGSEALAALPNFHPQVLVCDIGMPNMDGYTLMQCIRNLPPEQGGEIPAIAVTAFAKSEDARRALNHGFQTHIPKPIEPEILISEILELVK